MILALFILGWR